jgi:hypothetical protein
MKTFSYRAFTLLIAIGNVRRTPKIARGRLDGLSWRSPNRKGRLYPDLVRSLIRQPCSHRGLVLGWLFSFAFVNLQSYCTDLFAARSSLRALLRVCNETVPLSQELSY